MQHRCATFIDFSISKRIVVRHAEIGIDIILMDLKLRIQKNIMQLLNFRYCKVTIPTCMSLDVTVAHFLRVSIESKSDLMKIEQS